MSSLEAKLNDMLEKFGSTSVKKLSDKYVSYPGGDDEEKVVKGHPACLGIGGFGRVVRAKKVNAGAHDAPVVVKVMLKDRFKRTLDVQHLIAEVGISGVVDHKNLNKRIDLLHSHDKIFFILELVGAPAPDVLTRLAAVYAHNAPKRLPELDTLLPRWKQAAKSAGVDPENEEAFGDFVDKNRLIQGVASQLGSDKPYEMPCSCSLFDLVVAYRVVPEPMMKIITRQFLEGLECLHGFNIVHRDIKPENVMLQIYRVAKLKREGGKADGKIIGCTFLDRVEVKIIDFGLAKLLHLSKTAATGSSAARVEEKSAGAIQAELENSKKKAAEEKERIKAEIIARKTKEDPDYDPEYDEELTNSVEDELSLASKVETGFMVSNTPGVGTPVYLSLEMLDGCEKSGWGRQNFTSSAESLPKFDIFGVGACTYCEIMGRPPFRPHGGYSSEIQKYQHIRQLVAHGPNFTPSTTPEVYPKPSAEQVSFVSRLMHNDVKKRPSAREALQDPFLKEVDGDRDILVTEIDCAHPHDYKGQKGEVRRIPPMQIIRLQKRITASPTAHSPTGNVAEDALATAVAGGRGRLGYKFQGDANTEGMSAEEVKKQKDEQEKLEAIQNEAKFDVLAALRQAAEEHEGEK